MSEKTQPQPHAYELGVDLQHDNGTVGTCIGRREFVDREPDYLVLIDHPEREAVGMGTSSEETWGESNCKPVPK